MNQTVFLDLSLVGLLTDWLDPFIAEFFVVFFFLFLRRVCLLSPPCCGSSRRPEQTADLGLLLSDTQPSAGPGPSCFPSHPTERCHSICGWRVGVVGEQGLGAPLSALLCLLNLRASVRTGKPGEHGPVSLFWTPVKAGMGPPTPPRLCQSSKHATF